MRLPVGYRASAFEPVASRVADYMTLLPGGFRTIGVGRPVNVVAWREIHEREEASDVHLAGLLEQSDVVIVNGEGSIHHNLRRALALLSIMMQCTNAGKPFLLLNATVQGMEPCLLRAAIEGASFVHARESLTSELLRPFMPNICVAPDLALLSILRLPERRRQMGHDQCLITAGVVANPETFETIFSAVRRTGLDPVYLRIGDGGEGPRVKAACARQDVPVIDATSLTLQDLNDFLSTFKVAISGRHHINLFLWRAGVPFVPLPSNTWKIDGTLRDLGYPIAIARTPSEAAASLYEVLTHRDKLSQLMIEQHEDITSRIVPIVGKIGDVLQALQAKR